MKGKYEKIVKEMIKYSENCSNLKLRLHSSHIIKSPPSFSIPSHIDGGYFLVYHDSDNKKYYGKAIKVPNPENVLDDLLMTELQPFNAKFMESGKPVPSYNLDNYEFYHDKTAFPSPFGYTGGQNDTYHSVSCIVYLNTSGKDYEGGELLLGIDKKIIPKKGNVGIFTGGPENVHRVTDVKSGTRYAFLFWLSHIDGPYLRNAIFANEEKMY